MSHKSENNDLALESSVTFPLYFREASRRRATFGHLGSQSGKFWCWLRKCPTMDWQTKRSSTTATTSTVKTRLRCGLWSSQRDVLVKYTTSCVTVGLRMTRVDQLSMKYICSYREKMRGIVQRMKNRHQWSEKHEAFKQSFLCRGWAALVFWLLCTYQLLISGLGIMMVMMMIVRMTMMLMLTNRDDYCENGDSMGC